MLNNNVSVGNSVEQAICKFFQKHHYWAYNCPKNSSGGQPVDVIAYRGGEENGKGSKFWYVDGKNVNFKKVSFVLDRTEDNQMMSMNYVIHFAKANDKYVGFVVYFERTEQFYWLPYEKVLEVQKSGSKSVNLSDMRLFEEVLNENDN